jgi:hypothetical protein
MFKTRLCVYICSGVLVGVRSEAVARQRQQCVVFFWSVPRLLPEGRNSAVICFQIDPTKAAIYWTSQPELQKDEMSTGGFFSGGKTVGAWSWDTTRILITPVSLASRRATGWTAGVGFPAGARCFSSPQRSGRFWGPPNLLSNEYRGSFSVG